MNENAKLEMFQDNMKINDNLLKACDEFHVCQITH
jgi:hypothetical protein